MKNRQLGNEKNFIFFISLSILLILNTLYRSSYEVLQSVGDITLNLTLVLMAFYVLVNLINENYFSKDLTKVYLSLSLFILIYIISFLVNKNMDGVSFSKLLFFYIFILGTLKLNWNRNHIKIFAYVISLMVILIFIHWVLLDFTGYRFKSIYKNPNYLGVLLFLMQFFLLLAIKYGSFFERIYFSVLSILNIVIIYNTNSRAVLLAILVVILVWTTMKLTPKLFRYVFLIFIVVNTLFLFVYIRLQSTGVGLFLNDFIQNVTGKSLYSGRSTLWQNIIAKTLDSPIKGHGVGIKAKDLVETNLTSHNQYIQIFMETGFIGLLAFVFVLYSIWKVLIKKSNSFVAKLSACFLISFLVYENFELTLFQNNYSIAMIQWVILSVGVSFVYKDNLE